MKGDPNCPNHRTDGFCSEVDTNTYIPNYRNFRDETSQFLDIHLWEAIGEMRVNTTEFADKMKTSYAYRELRRWNLHYDELYWSEALAMTSR